MKKNSSQSQRKTSTPGIGRKSSNSRRHREGSIWLARRWTNYLRSDINFSLIIKLMEEQELDRVDETGFAQEEEDDYEEDESDEGFDPSVLARLMKATALPTYADMLFCEKSKEMEIRGSRTHQATIGEIRGLLFSGVSYTDLFIAMMNQGNMLSIEAEVQR